MTAPEPRPERWIPIPGYQSYEVSDLGHVRSLDHVTVDNLGRQKAFKGKLLKGTGGPYDTVTVRGPLGPSVKRVHELVLLAFVGPRPEGMQHIRHLNGAHRDNRLENLAYGTASENGYDMTIHGRNKNALKTHCKQGHPFDEANTAWRSGGGRNCRRCHNKGIGVHPNTLKTHCPKGHPYAGENLRVDNRGGRSCKACARLKSNARTEKLRQAACDVKRPG